MKYKRYLTLPICAVFGVTAFYLLNKSDALDALHGTADSVSNPSGIEADPENRARG